MTQEGEDILYIRSIEKWGIESQVRICIEECAELIQALSKFGRKINGSTALEIRGELADVDICVSQLKLYFDKAWVDNIKDDKLRRLSFILSNDKEPQSNANSS